MNGIVQPQVQGNNPWDAAPRPAGAPSMSFDQISGLVQQAQQQAAGQVSQQVVPPNYYQGQVPPNYYPPQPQMQQMQQNPYQPQMQQTPPNYYPPQPQMSQMPAVQPMVNTTPLPTGQRFDVNTIGSCGGMSVEHFFKFKAGIMKIGDKPIRAGVRCKVDIDTVAYKTTILQGKQNPEYFSTYDGNYCDKGGLWADRVRQIKQMDPSAREYQSCDLVFVLLEPAMDQSGKIEVAPAGTQVGYCPPGTSFKEWHRLHLKAVELGKATVNLRLGLVNKSSKGNDWSAANFELIDFS